jgi:hypothetical protein
MDVTKEVSCMQGLKEANLECISFEPGRDHEFQTLTQLFVVAMML